MKIVIDIANKIYSYALHYRYTKDDVVDLMDAVKIGIPLDKVLEDIRAEIDEIPLSEPMVSADGLYCYGSKSITMGHFREKVFEIIDRHMGKERMNDSKDRNI